MSTKLLEMQVDNNDAVPRKMLSPVVIDILFLTACCLILLMLTLCIIFMRQLPIPLLMLVILSLIAIPPITFIAARRLWFDTKRKQAVSPPSSNKTGRLNHVLCSVNVTLTVFTLLFSASVMSPLNLGYGSFATFVLFLVYMSTVIWILTLLVYVTIVFIRFLWKQTHVIRQELSYGTVSFFIGSFLASPFFMLVIAMISSAAAAGLGLGLALALNIVLIAGCIAAVILYRSKMLRIICCTMALIGCVGFSLILWFYVSEGSHEPITVITPTERQPRNLTNDPSANGNYSYSSLTYGSGIGHRIEYGLKASIKTPTIDLSSIITLSEFNQQILQYNESAIPLNGKIWYPTNTAQNSTFPLVVMVHGNHMSTEPSENGYEYLGTMLASQGFLAVSIDQNFLNLAPPYVSTEYGRMSKIKWYDVRFSQRPEFIARAIVVLETLKQLRSWNNDHNNQFYNRLDLSNIGLMGHSRGGETIAIAHMLNRLKYIPEYPINWPLADYNFNIKALFSISGTDGAYKPSGHDLELHDVTVFAIHGMYDGDLLTFEFQGKLTNSKFTSNSSQYNFKASLYVHQANHGQFNTDWGRYDSIPGVNNLLNVRPMMKIEEQQHICKIYMAALMNAVLKNETQYRILFEDYRAALTYLPRTNYVSTFQDSREVVIADFENHDITVGTIEGSMVNITNLELWGSVYVEIYRSAMLILQPVRNSVGKYEIKLQNSVNGINLRFMAGRPKEGLVDNLTVLVWYDDGTFDSFVVRVLPALAKRVFKLKSTEYVTALQTISLPLRSPMVALEFVVNGDDALFLLDNVVVTKQVDVA